MNKKNSDEELERLVNEYVDRWYLSEDGDSDALIVSSKGEMKRQMVSIVKSRDQQIALAARKQTVQVLKSRMLKHFTKWGGNQGNCVTEDTLDDYLESINATLKQAQEKSDE